jgi:hypothetical protein
VTSFQLELKNQVVEGVIKERGEARREYTQAIQEGHRAAIAEEERAGVSKIRSSVFSLTVFRLYLLRTIRNLLGHLALPLETRKDIKGMQAHRTMTLFFLWL